jgi:hypothetical protein
MADESSSTISGDTCDRVVSSTRRRGLCAVSVEDAFDCPLIELGLIDEVERGLYRFTRGYRNSLPQEILAFAVLDYWNTHMPEQKSLSFERLQYWAGSPGAAFKLSDNALAERLEILPDWIGLIYDETAGTRVLLKSPEADKLAANPMVLLERYYSQSRNQAG